jgi:hypothetical protein
MNTNTTLRNTLQSALLTATLLLGMSAAQAQLVTNNIAVQNFSFETPVTANAIGVGQFAGGNSLANYGWQIDGANTYLVKNGGGSATYTSGVVGNQALFFEPYNDGNVMVYQNLSENFAAGTYNLSVNVGMGSGFADYGELATAEFQLLSFGSEGYNYNLGVSATSVLVKNYQGALTTFNYTLTLNGTERFIGDEIAIVLKGNPNGSTFQNVSYDNVQLTYVAAIPEPSTYALILGGIATLLLIRRRVQS